MSIEDSGTINEVDAEEQAAFLAEMATPTTTDEQLPELESTPEQPAEEPAQEVVAEAEQPYTRAEIQAAFEQIKGLQSALDKTNGTYGSRLAEQQKVIDELRQQRQSGIGTLTPDKLTRLSAEFPEIAEMLAGDLSDFIGQGGSSFDPTQLENAMSTKFNAVEERIEKKERELEVRALTRHHRDWKEVASFDNGSGEIVWNNQQFGNFVSTLSAEDQQEILNGTNADFLAEKITDFKATIKPKVVSKQVINAAVLPRSAGGKAPSNELDEEEAAYRAEMARQ